MACNRPDCPYHHTNDVKKIPTLPLEISSSQYAAVLRVIDVLIEKSELSELKAAKLKYKKMDPRKITLDQCLQDFVIIPVRDKKLRIHPIEDYRRADAKVKKNPHV